MPEKRKTAQLARNIGQGGKPLRYSVAQTKRPLTKKKATATTSETTQKDVKDARELLSSRPPVGNFPTITFTEENTQPVKQHSPKVKTTQAVQTENFKVLVGTQTDVSKERPETQEQFVSRTNYNIASQEERAPNEEPPTITRTQPEATQLETSHHKSQKE